MTDHVESDPRVRAWLTIADHPFFADCYSADGTLLDAMLAELDAAHTHTCQPAWRPVSFDEIQAGWEIRSRRGNGSEAGWGVAHHQGDDGDWYTETGSLLTFTSYAWTYETTAPAVEPKPDPRIQVVLEWSKEPPVTDHEDAIELLARLDGLTGGERP